MNGNGPFLNAKMQNIISEQHTKVVTLGGILLVTVALGCARSGGAGTRDYFPRVAIRDS